MRDDQDDDEEDEAESQVRETPSNALELFSFDLLVKSGFRL